MRIVFFSLLSLLLCGYAHPLEMEKVFEKAGENREEVEKLVEEAEKKGYKNG